MSQDTFLVVLRNRFYCGYVSYRRLGEIYTESKRRRKSRSYPRWVKGMPVLASDEG